MFRPMKPETIARRAAERAERRRTYPLDLLERLRQDVERDPDNELWQELYAEQKERCRVAGLLS